MGKELKAYIVRDIWCENGAVITWAESVGKAKAKALYNDTFDNMEYTELRAERKKEYDKYSETKKIPIEELLADGWWFYCHGYCCGQLSQDDIDNGNAIIINNEDDGFVKGAIICKTCHNTIKEKLTCP